MFALCIEASHSKGMGHLFRMLNFSTYLDKQNEEFVFFINNDNKTKHILNNNNINYETVDLFESQSNWENDLIGKYEVDFWINDRLNTTEKHSLNIKKNHIKLITFDDLGSGAKNSDINVCGLFFNNSNLQGKQILKGKNYLILNSEINAYKKERTGVKNILVTLGGSDTYGVTVKILKILKKYNIKATIHTGPSFKHLDELNLELTSDYEVISFIPSLIKEFNKYDLAITGGGVTPFEANASGLPCLIVANEIFEIPNAEFLDGIETSKFIGYYDDLKEDIFYSLDKIDINSMSKNGMKKLNTNAMSEIYKKMKQL
jgi:spore coat polysaccharide biosynthesis predicted glycosyltransferase SpsG